MASETRRDLLILGAISLFFLLSTQALSFVGPLYPSPDETINAFFAEIFADQGRLFSFEPLNLFFDDALFPRSALALNGRILPISFVGLPIFFGGLIKVFGFWSLPLWTPFFASLAVLAWYAIVRQWLGRQIGFWSAVLLFFTPAWWYWSARPLMHNVLFVSFLIFFGFFLVVQPIFQKSKIILWADYLLAGLMLATAVWIRTSEIFWLAPAAIFTLLVLRKKISWPSFLVFVATLIVALAPLLFLNNFLYGDYFLTGYTAVSSVDPIDFNTAASVGARGGAKGLSPLRAAVDSLLPFGFHPYTIVRNLWDYGFVMVWWLTIPALIGFCLLVLRRAGLGSGARGPSPLHGLVLAAVILAIVYGSAEIHDNPDVSAITIGNSYSRYWLPLFVAATPLAAMAILRFGDWVRFIGNKNFCSLRTVVAPMCLIVFSLLSFNLVFFSSDDALWPTRQRLIASSATRERVLELTEPEAVIIVDRADKLFFPERRVRFPLRDETTYRLMPGLAAEAPLYYFGITFPEADIVYLNEEKLEAMDLHIDFIENFGEESLYRIGF